ncbi:MAG: hypothetical protein JKY02_08870 [Flavobacteriaceae bacterium]|nr:hypothetical protein [Flavobacteriaceae bacterium]
MSRILTLSLLFLSLVFSSNTNAQSKKAPCSSEKYQEFSFWVGDWNVYNTENKLIGTNTILKMQGNCVMQENWESKTGTSRGTSYNYYNKTDDTWNQVWIDNSGYSLVLKGNLENGKMVLKSDLIEGAKNTYYNRITWTPNEDGTVTQVWDYLDKGEKVLTEAFRGIYKKKTNK